MKDIVKRHLMAIPNVNVVDCLKLKRHGYKLIMNSAVDLEKDVSP